jgi:hypothetical protein
MRVKTAYSTALVVAGACTWTLLASPVTMAAEKAKPVASKKCEVDPLLAGPGEKAAWQGGCIDGKPDGKGVLTWLDAKKKMARTYTGELKLGLLQGDGELVFADGKRYTGQFTDGKFHGNGTYTLPNGDKYTGVFANGTLLEAATYTFANGERYVGQLQEHRPHGQGSFFLRNGESYEGQFSAGAISSPVVYRFANGTRFEGTLANGAPSGKGVLYLKDDERVEGLFAGGAVNGEGRYTYNSGRRFEGTLANNKPQGKGTLFLPDGSKIEGSFDADGMPAGPVVIEFANKDRYEGPVTNLVPDGNGTLRAASGLVYVGAFKQGMRTGQAKINYASGASYQGSVKNGVRDGTGDYTWASGASYKGAFSGGIAHGVGELRWADGRSYKGQFASGLPAGKGTLERPDGWRYEGGFERGAFHGSATMRMPSKATFTGTFAMDLREGAALMVAPDGEKTEQVFIQDAPKENRGPHFSMFKNKEEELAGLVTDAYYGWGLRYHTVYREYFDSRRDKVKPLLDRLGEGLVSQHAMRIAFLAMSADMLLADGELASLASIDTAKLLLGQAVTELNKANQVPLAAGTAGLAAPKAVLEAVVPGLAKSYLALMTAALGTGRYEDALKIIGATRRVEVELANPQTVAAFNDYLVRSPEQLASKSEALGQLKKAGFAPDQARLAPALEAKIDQVIAEGDLNLALRLVSAADALQISLMTPARITNIAQLLAGRVRASRHLALPFDALPASADRAAILNSRELQRAWIDVLAGHIEQGKEKEAATALRRAHELKMTLPPELATAPLTRALKLCMNRYDIRALLSMLAELPPFGLNLTQEFKRQVVFLRSGTTSGTVPFPLNIKNETGLSILNADDFLDNEQEALDLLQQYEYVVLLDIHPRHTERRLNQRKQTKSSFSEGMEEVINPEYQQMEAQLRNAQAELGQAQQNQASAGSSGGGSAAALPNFGNKNLNNLGAVLSLFAPSGNAGAEAAQAQASAALGKVQGLQAQLGRMQRTSKQPIKVDYRYEELNIDILRNVPVTAYVINRGEGVYVSRKLALQTKDPLASTLGVHSKDKTAKRLDRIDRIRQIERTPVNATLLGLLGTEQITGDTVDAAKENKDAGDLARPAQIATISLDRLPFELADNRDAREQAVMQALDASNQKFDKSIQALLPALHEDARARDEQVVELLLQSPDIAQRSGRDARRLAGMLIKLAASKKAALAAPMAPAVSASR